MGPDGRAKSSLVPAKGGVLMKKLFEIKVRGYYILSVVAGILLGLFIMIVANVLLMQAELNAISGRREQTIAGWSLQYDYLDSVGYDCALQLIPLKGLFNAAIDHHATVLLALLCIATVVLFATMITMAKHWRTKFLQSVGWALLFLFVTETVIVNVNLLGLVETFGVIVFLPAILLIIPVLILCKTYVPDLPLKNNKSTILDEIARFDSPEAFVRQCMAGEELYSADGRKIPEEEVIAAASKVWDSANLEHIIAAKKGRNGQKKVDVLAQELSSVQKADISQRGSSVQKADEVRRL